MLLGKALVECWGEEIEKNKIRRAWRNSDFLTRSPISNPVMWIEADAPQLEKPDEMMRRRWP